MAFGIIRARNLSAGAISNTDKHNARRYESKTDYPENITPNGRHQEAYILENKEDHLHKKNFNLQQAIDDRLEKNNVKGIRKNSNLAIEYVCTVNDQKAWEQYSFSGYVSNTKKWLEDRHGKNSIVASYEHLDESNPHVHFIVVPLKTKEVKWKNQKGEGVRIETRINTRDYTGGRDKLRDLQNDYFEHLTERYDGGKKMGIQFYRGTLVEHQHKVYTQETDHKIGELRKELSKTDDSLKRLKLELLIEEKRKEQLEAEKEFKTNQSRHNSYNRKNWDSKGTRDNPTIFHSNEDGKTKKKKGRSI